MNKTFYFLVFQTEHVEAGNYAIQLKGGAGYFLEYENQPYLAFSVYLDESEGIAVQSAVADAQLLSISVDRLYLKTCVEKRNAPVYQGALDCLYGCMEVLGFQIARLDNGETQQSAMKTLALLLKQLRYLAMAYKGEYANYAEVCQRAGNTLGDIITEVIYTRDLRYLLCDIALSYIRLAAKFSL